MATGKGIRAGGAFVELFADPSKLKRGLKQASAELKAWGAGVATAGAKIMAVGTAVVAGFLGMAVQFANAADEIEKAGAVMGMATDELQSLKYAAELSGASLDDLKAGTKGMAKLLDEASQGGKAAVETLDRLGLSASELERMSIDDRFRALSEALSQVEDPGERAALAMKTFGKSGMNLLPMLAEGRKGIEALEREARRLGLIMSKEDVAAGVLFSDTLDTLWKVIARTAQIIGAAVMPILQPLADGVITIVVAINKWVDQNRELFRVILMVAGGVAAAGAALVAIGTSLILAGAAIGGMLTIASAVATVFSTIVAVVGFLISPLGLLITAVVGVGAAFAYSEGLFGEFADFAKTAWVGLVDDATAAWDGIVGAIKGGDLKLAMAIALGFLKLQWVKFKGWLSTLWHEIVGAMSKAFLSLAVSIGQAFGVAFSGVLALGATLIGGLKSMAVGIAQWFDEKYDDVVTAEQRTRVRNNAEYEGKSKEETEELLKQVDRAAKNRKLDRDQKNTAEAKAVEDETKAKIDDIWKTHEQRINDMNALEKAAGDALDTRTAAEIAAAQKEYDAAMAEFGQLAAQGKAKGDMAPEERAKLKKQAFEIEAGFMQAEKVVRQGTFSAAAARGFGAGGGVQERIEKLTKEQLIEQRNLNKAIRAHEKALDEAIRFG